MTKTYNVLIRRVQSCAALPIATLDALKGELTQIGRTE